jgi:hypothetical protein
MKSCFAGPKIPRTRGTWSSRASRPATARSHDVARSQAYEVDRGEGQHGAETREAPPGQFLDEVGEPEAVEAAEQEVEEPVGDRQGQDHQESGDEGSARWERANIDSSVYGMGEGLGERHALVGGARARRGFSKDNFVDRNPLKALHL